jgi:hypothetical protein
MKKFKKLFNLLPAFALAFISGLGVVLDYDQTPKEANADTNLLVSNKSYSNYNLTYTNSNVTFNMLFDFDINFYHDLGPDNYYFVLNAKYKVSQWNMVYNNISYPFGTSPSDSHLDDVNFTMTTGRFVRTSSSNTADLRFYIGNIATDTSLNGFYENFMGSGHNVWWYYFRINYTLSISGFNPLEATLCDKDLGSWNVASYYFGTSSSPSAITTNSISKSGLTLVGYHQVDFTKSNYDLGYSDGYSAGYTAGNNDGYNVGYDSGNTVGYNNGYEVGYQAGVDSQQQAISDAYNNGYNTGYEAGFSTDSTAATIFSGILQVGMLPINILLAIFNFEILGINLSAFISAILTVCLTVIVIRTVTGGKNSE